MIKLTFIFLLFSSLSYSQSVFLSGYDKGRSGTVKLNQKWDFEQLKYQPGPWGSDASKHMPLLIDAKNEYFSFIDQGDPIFKKKVLFYTSNYQKRQKNNQLSFISAMDLDTGRILWRVFDSRFEITSTGALSTSFGRLYYLSKFYLISLKLDGSDLQFIPLNLRKKLATDPKLSRNDFLKRIACKTALNINGSEIVFGCSTPKGYGVGRGSTRGMFLSYALDFTGRIKGADQYKIFFPSKKTPDPNTGFNTGIWNTGSGPTILRNGDYLISTGNGPLFKKKKNFGCSVIRLSKDLWEPVKSWSTQDIWKDSEECFSHNLDMSSSAVASINFNKQEFAVLLGKPGYVGVFSPEWSGISSLLQVGSILYGQVNLIPLKREFIIITPAKILKNEVDSVIKSEGQLTSEEKDDNVCLGFLSKIGKNEAIELSSGGFRNNPFLASSNWSKLSTLISPLNYDSSADKMTPRKYFAAQTAPYRIKDKIGYFYEKDDDKKFPGFKTVPVCITKNGNRFQNCKTDQGEIIGYLLQNKNGECTKRPTKDSIAAFMTYRPFVASQREDRIEALSYTPEKNQLKRNWEYVLKKGESLPRTNMVTLMAKDKTITFSVFDEASGSSLNLFDTINGQQLKHIPFSGRTHFSMPLIHNKGVVVATKDKGLQFFSKDMRYSTFWFYWDKYLWELKRILKK